MARRLNEGDIVLITMGGILPAFIGCLWLLALGSDPNGPCGSGDGDGDDARITLHLWAMAKHACGATMRAALLADRMGPCRPGNKSRAVTVRGHLRAISNHARAASALIARKTGATG